MDAVKLILAGADAVQVVSAIYLKGAEAIESMLAEIRKFMEEHNFTSYNDFRGLLSKKNTKDPYVYKRAQYVDLLLHSDKVMKVNRMV